MDLNFLGTIPGAIVGGCAVLTIGVIAQQLLTKGVSVGKKDGNNFFQIGNPSYEKTNKEWGEVRDAIKALPCDFNQVHEVIKEFPDKISDLKGVLAALQASLPTRLVKLETKLDQFSNELSEMKEVMDSIQASCRHCKEYCDGADEEGTQSVAAGVPSGGQKSQTVVDPSAN